MATQFIVEKEVNLKEINAKVIILRHPCGAKVIHIETDDDENAFCISFRTYPETGNGVAHILEHTVLCGSKRFPVKDPFFLMNRRSLNTFMNAFTGSDFTCYPAATQNKEDFYNLLDVYLDAVFFPNLNRLSFLQEGHRVEFEKSDDPSSALQFKGVVYNEMKGSYASPDRRFHEVINEKLYPTLTYGIDSGGKPDTILKLTYDDLIAFHDTYYHPSHALFYFYGNMPLDEHLKFIEEKVLAHAEPRPDLAPLPKEKRYTTPVQFEAPFPIGSEEDRAGKTRIGISWLTTYAADQLSSLALNVLVIALMDTDASPLKKMLLQLKEVKQVSLSIDTDSSEVPISLNFRGCEEGDAPKIERETLRFLKEIADQPIDRELLESAIHQIALHRSEIVGDDLPWGLHLFMRCGLIAQLGGDPIDALKIHTLFDQLKEEWKKDPEYFNKLLKTHFIDNPHRVTLTLYPDHALQEKEEEQEKRKLEEIKNRLTAEDVQLIINDAEALYHLQEEGGGDEDVLPKLHLSAIPKDPKDYLLQEGRLEDIHLFTHETFTNGIVYVDYVLPIPQLKIEELPFLRLLVNFVTQVGAGGKTYEETLRLMQSKTGGISASIHLFHPIDRPKDCLPCFVISGKSLDEDVESLFKMLTDFLRTPDFTDTRRLQELWEKHTTALFTSIPGSAMRYATLLSSAPFSAGQNLSERLFGLDYLWTISQWKGPKLIQKIQEMLKTLAALILTQKGDLVVTASSEICKKIKSNKAFGLPQGAKRKYDYLQIPPYPAISQVQAKSFASSVSFISQVFPSVPYTHPAAPALSLASFILDNQTLHTEIRERGGAYGAGSRQKSGNSVFSFYSYRDPHIGDTLQTFDNALEKLVKEGIEESEREEAILEMLQGLDDPISPGHRGMTVYSWLKEGRTYEVRKNYRQRLLATTSNDIVKAVKDYLIPNRADMITVIAAGKEMLLQENKKRAEKGLKPIPISPLDRKSQ